MFINNLDEDLLSELIEYFDSQNLDNKIHCRYAFKSLFDYCQNIFLSIGPVFTELPRNYFSKISLKQKWNFIEPYLIKIEVPQLGREVVNKLNSIRQKIEHNDEYFPEKKDLNNLRQQLPKFYNWLIPILKEYDREKNKKTVKHQIYEELFNVMINADWIFELYGKKLPYVAKFDGTTSIENNFQYNRLFRLTDQIRNRLNSIEIEEIRIRDLKNLLKMREYMSDFHGKEYLLRCQGICPKCGGKIIESEEVYITSDGEFPLYICKDCGFGQNYEDGAEIF